MQPSKGAKEPDHVSAAGVWNAGQDVKGSFVATGVSKNVTERLVFLIKKIRRAAGFFGGIMESNEATNKPPHRHLSIFCEISCKLT